MTSHEPACQARIRIEAAHPALEQTADSGDVYSALAPRVEVDEARDPRSLPERLEFWLTLYRQCSLVIL